MLAIDCLRKSASINKTRLPLVANVSAKFIVRVVLPSFAAVLVTTITLCSSF